MANSEQWTNACTASQLEPGGQFEWHANGKPVLICRSGDKLFAIDGLCSHKHRPLLGGKIDNHQLHCPHHAACFDLKTGNVLKAPAFKALQVYKVRQHGEWIQLLLTPSQPTID